MNSEMTSRSLPDAAVDHGDRLEVRPDAGPKRFLGTAIAIIMIVAGLALALLAPAGLADDLLARAGIGGALVVAGLAGLATRNRRVEVDGSGITQHGILGSRRIASPQVEAIEIDEHDRRSSSTFSRRIAGVRIGLGRGRDGMEILGFRRRRWTVSMLVRGRGARDITIGLGDATLEEGQALAEEVRRRASLPDTVEVDIHSDRVDLDR